MAARNNVASINAEATATSEPQDRTLVITREFNAEPAAVFKAWTDPKALLQWMGPRQYPAFHVEQDLRVGGAYRIGLRGIEDGRELWQSGVYHKIASPRRLVFSFAWDNAGGGKGPETLVAITLTARGDQTVMTFRQSVFDTTSNRDGHETGWQSAFDRLDEALARVSA